MTCECAFDAAALLEVVEDRSGDLPDSARRSLYRGARRAELTSAMELPRVRPLPDLARVAQTIVIPRAIKRRIVGVASRAYEHYWTSVAVIDGNGSSGATPWLRTLEATRGPRSRHQEERPESYARGRARSSPAMGG